LEHQHPKVRPTTARVRKSLLEILEPFQGQTVLDLFAGVGTLGIEAISRGASSVTFVEKERAIMNMLRSNLSSICASDKYETILTDVRIYARHKEPRFNIIIADPPYGVFRFYDLRDMLEPLLVNGGVFCMEMRKTPILDDRVRVKLYGKTQVVFWEKTA